jgi:hypothetical protein
LLVIGVQNSKICYFYCSTRVDVTVMSVSMHHSELPLQLLHPLLKVVRDLVSVVDSVADSVDCEMRNLLDARQHEDLIIDVPERDSCPSIFLFR